MAFELTTYIPFQPTNYNLFSTADNNGFYVKEIVEGADLLVLYKNTAEINRVNKNKYLTPVGSISCVYRDASSITDLTILIEYDKPIDFNYVHSYTFKRDYFVTDVRIIQHNMYEIDLTVDVLMSYRSALYNLTAFVDRNENKFNSNIIDKKRVISQGYDVSVKNIYNDVIPDILYRNSLNIVMNGYKLDVVAYPKE